ncbi:MAG: YhjD/YihY/BrkB family envelope integrity protein, partial [Coprobacillus sp.]
MKVFYEKCVKIYDDYRAVVPSYAPAALSFYLLLIMIPIFSLLAIGTSLLNIDLTFVTELINQVIVKEYADMLIEVLQSKSVNTVAVVTMGISLYTVSRGIGNIYEISKNMYQHEDDEGLISYYFYTFKVTIFLIVLLIGIIAVIAIGPLAIIFNFL